MKNKIFFYICVLIFGLCVIEKSKENNCKKFEAETNHSIAIKEVSLKNFCVNNNLTDQCQEKVLEFVEEQKDLLNKSLIEMGCSK